MVLYFSGTGNSRFVARKISLSLGDELVDLGKRIREGDISTLSDEKRFVFVVPTYAWRIPHLVEKFIEKAMFDGTKKVWFVMTCGGEIGNAEKYLLSLCEKKGFEYMGVYPVVMPENYVAMFSVPDEKASVEIIKSAEPKIQNAAFLIGENKKFPQPRNNLYDRFMSGPVNQIFYSVFVKADAFTAGEKCIGCKKCEKLCPLNNIKIQNGRPVWGKNCTHCMACICLCAEEAIEYGKKSQGKRRYHLD
ncbi:MAG: EFR1 family ferrodoxin [Clostridia bacterium]|nr:EFR1 family ferrodoxin [Clostridia bacterium]